MRVALSIGCPSGVGPEVAVEAVASRGRAASGVVLVGDLAVVRRAAKVRGVDPRRVVAVEDPARYVAVPAGGIAVWSPRSAPALALARDARFGAPSRAAGAAQLAWVDAACDLASSGAVDAMVTGPVSKEAIAASGAPGARGFTGHTEHLQRRLGAREVVMAFFTERLTTGLATTHLPLADVPAAVTKEAVASAAYWVAALAVDLRSSKRSAATVDVAVCGLNPHAGEGGLLGKEETKTIAPGIARARARLAKDGGARARARLVGPVPAESAFRLAVAGRFAAVVAMYHDAATIPMKILGFGEAVNVSLGLPIVRTSVDHGTAYDIAGKGRADARGMEEALSLAARLVNARDRETRSRR